VWEQDKDEKQQKLKYSCIAVLGTTWKLKERLTMLPYINAKNWDQSCGSLKRILVGASSDFQEA